MGLSIASLRLAPVSKDFKVQGATFQENNGSRGTEAVICWSTAAHLALWRLQGLKVGKLLQLPGLEMSSEETSSGQSAPSTAMALTGVVCACDCFQSGKAEKKTARPISAHVVNRMQ